MVKVTDVETCSCNKYYGFMICISWLYALFGFECT